MVRACTFSFFKHDFALGIGFQILADRQEDHAPWDNGRVDLLLPNWLLVNQRGLIVPVIHLQV